VCRFMAILLHQKNKLSTFNYFFTPKGLPKII
jgi:hypothetical protein